jgi:8-oxo-dGTP diphosphatase
MGKWNGVGGKLNPGETAYECIVRETLEETGLKLPQYRCRGILMWDVREYGSLNSGDIDSGGLYLFTAEVSKQQVEEFSTPQLFDEGILHWHSVKWITDAGNLGIVDNVKIVFQNNTIFNSSVNDLFTVKYQDNNLISFVHLPGKNNVYLD